MFLTPPVEMICPSLFAALLSALLVVPSSGITITQTSQLTTLTYDYIIIGGVSRSSPSEIQEFHENIYQPVPLDLSSRTAWQKIQKSLCWFWKRAWGKAINDGDHNSAILIYRFLVMKESLPPLHRSLHQR